MHTDEWPVIDTHTEYANEWFTAGYDLVRCPDGVERRFYWTDPPDGAEVVAIDDDELILIEQYRPRFRETVLECPGGGVDPGETPCEAGRRELREETGHHADEVSELLTYYPSPWMRMQRTVVFASGLSSVDADHGPHEFPNVRRVSIDDAFEIAQNLPVSGLLVEPLLIARFFDVL